jgi:MerC mercury resistance protein
MNTRRSRWSSLAALPAAFLSLLPAVTCSACLGAYAGLLSALGLGFLVRSTVLEPLLISTLLIGLGSIVWSTLRQRNPWPLALTLLGDLAVVIGRYAVASQEMQWLGFPLILGGALWSIWLRRRLPASQECAACVADQPGLSQLTKPKEASR